MIQCGHTKEQHLHLMRHKTGCIEIGTLYIDREKQPPFDNKKVKLSTVPACDQYYIAPSASCFCLYDVLLKYMRVMPTY